MIRLLIVLLLSLGSQNLLGFSPRMQFHFDETLPVVYWHDSDRQMTHGDNSVTELTVARPTNLRPGDLIIVIASVRGTTRPIPPPAGFTTIREEDGGNTNTGYAIAFYKIAAENEPATYTMASNPNAEWFALSGRVTGHDLINPIGNHSGANSGTSSVTSLAIPSLTTTVNNALLFATWSNRAVTTDAAAPGSMQQHWAHNTPRPMTIGASEQRETVGATGTRTATWTGGQRAAGLMFEILPARQNTFLDSSGTENHGYCVNADCPLMGEGGKFGMAARFSGGEEIIVPADSTLDFGAGDMAISAWIFPTLTSPNRIIVCRADGSGGGNSGYRYLIHNTDASRLLFIRGSLFADGVQSNAGVITLNRWHHVVVILDAGTITHYVNGVAAGSGAAAGWSASPTNPELHIGFKSYAASGSGYFVGTMDEIAIYPHALTTDDVRGLHRAGEWRHFSRFLECGGLNCGFSIPFVPPVPTERGSFIGASTEE